MGRCCAVPDWASDRPAGLFDEGDGNQKSLPEEDEQQDDDDLQNSQDDHCKPARASDEQASQRPHAQMQ